MDKKISGVMYGKFNNNDSRGRIIVKNDKGSAIVDRPFKDVLDEVVKEKPVLVVAPVEVVDKNPMDEPFIWKAAFDKRRRGL